MNEIFEYLPGALAAVIMTVRIAMLLRPDGMGTEAASEGQDL